MNSSSNSVSYNTQCKVNKRSVDDFRGYYDYRDDISDDVLDENDVPGSRFTVQYIDPLEPPADLADQWTMILLHGLNSSADVSVFRCFHTPAHFHSLSRVSSVTRTVYATLLE